MTHFTWTPELETGNRFIDDDHRKLITMVNALFDALAKGHAGEVVGKVLHNLILYTQDHFAREEAEMQRIRYGAAIAHKLEHAQLLKQVRDLKASLDQGAKVNAVTVSAFLGEWLRKHIMNVDMKLALALKAEH